MTAVTRDDARADWRLVFRKELADLFGRLGRKPLTRTIGVVAIFGILIPLRFSGAAYLPAFFAVFMAFLPTRLVAIESFAGERERGTLESLLTLPIPDHAIAVGKIAAATAYGAARGWLFVAVWLLAAGVGTALGVLPAGTVPPGTVVLATIIGSFVVALVAAVFGVWQSARAPSVRAIVESGGLLRLLLIVTVFFVGPWLLGLLSPDGVAPAVRAGGRTLSVESLRLAAQVRPGVLTAVVVIAGVAAVVFVVVLFADTLRRCRREALALVADSPSRPH